MTTKPTLEPKDHAEALALFRSEIVGSLVRRELEHGDLRAVFRELSEQRFRPPRSHGPRTYSPATLGRRRARSGTCRWLSRSA